MEERADGYSTQGKLLVVDDDKTLLRFLKDYLERDGFRIALAEGGSKAVRMFYEERPDLVILDVMMPGMDGWEVCARIREMADTPIIMLTAKGDESDKLRGFRLGVDDYVVKPFSLAELSARVKAVLARVRADGERPSLLEVGILRIDLVRREAWKGDESLELTPTEFRLLTALCRRPGEAVPRDQLILEVWGAHYDPKGGALRRFIWLLRQKIEEDPRNPFMIQTVRGYGYRIEP
ncbi:MAG: response regulator [Anaerolineales bacterium]|nr:response regulator [Anaerolineales bacterium]